MPALKSAMSLVFLLTKIVNRLLLFKIPSNYKILNKGDSLAIARKAGGIGAVVNVINKHIGNQEMCRVGCATLCVLTIADGK